MLDPPGELLPQRLEIVFLADALLDLVAALPDVLDATLVPGGSGLTESGSELYKARSRVWLAGW